MQKQSLTHFKKDSVRIVPFGGCGEFGMNMTAYICDDRLYLVDAGVSFPDPSKLGVDSIIPDMAEWIEQFGGVYAYIITHGHEIPCPWLARDPPRLACEPAQKSRLYRRNQKYIREACCHRWS